MTLVAFCNRMLILTELVMARHDVIVNSDFMKWVSVLFNKNAFQ